MSVSIEIKSDAIEKAQKYLAGVPKGFETAMMRSLNRALYEGRTVAIRETTARYTVKASEVRPTFKMTTAHKKNLTASLESKGASLTLSTFAHSPKTDTTGANRKQIRVAVKKSGLKPLGQAFVHKGRIYQRLGSSSYPISQRYGPSVPSMLNNDEVVDKVVEKMGESVEKRLEHETWWILEGQYK